MESILLLEERKKQRNERFSVKAKETHASRVRGTNGLVTDELHASEAQRVEAYGLLQNLAA